MKRTDHHRRHPRETPPPPAPAAVRAGGNGVSAARIAPATVARANRLFEILVLSAVGWNVFIFGGVWESYFSVGFALMAAALVVWGALRIARDAGWIAASGGRGAADARARRLRIQSRWVWILPAALAAWMVFQTVPLPAGIIGALSPRRAELATRLAAGLPELDASTITLAVDPRAARQSIFLVAFAAMSFVAGAYLGAARARARRAIAVLLFIALAQCLYALFESLSGHNYMLWIPVGGENARGTFFNRNHFAALLALLFPVAIGWFYHRAGEVKAGFEKESLLPATSFDILATRQGLWLLAPALLGLGVIQSHSRGGLAAMILGLALMFVIGARSRAVRALSLFGFLFGLTFFLYGMNSDYQVVLDRFRNLAEQEKGLLSRATMWKTCLAIIADYPVFGVGLGNFPRVYMQYQAGSASHYPFQAHNEWLEGFITLGIGGMLIAIASLVLFFIAAFFKAARAGRDLPWMLGAWCGLLGFSLHCFAEFNLHIPALAGIAALLAGTLLGFDNNGQARRSSTERLADNADDVGNADSVDNDDYVGTADSVTKSDR